MPKWSLLLVLLLGSGLLADVVELKDGTRLEGDLKRTSDGWTITASDGTTKNVAASAVKSIQLGSGPKGGIAAAAGLASLRRSVEALDNIDQIIERYLRFIENTKDTATLAEAQADLTQWQSRKQQGLIRHGSRWVLPEQVAELSAAATAKAVEARELIRQNRNGEAADLLNQAVQDDPRNPAALYLGGVVLYRQDKIPDARKAFEAADEILPAHAPTLNNLGVVLGRQNQHVPALNYYEQAMSASPVNRFILDNAAEALGALSDEQRKNPAVAKTLRRFTEQDLLLQQQMSAQGMYRWGSTWVDQKKLDELKAAEREVRSKLDAMQQEFQQTKLRIAQIDTEVAGNDTSMNAIAARSYTRDDEGNFIRLPLPSAYYDLERENRRLRSEQEALKLKLASMPEQAKRIQQQVPLPQFTGVQQIVGVEGMPEQEAAPATGPVMDGAVE